MRSHQSHDLSRGRNHGPNHDRQMATVDGMSRERSGCWDRSLYRRARLELLRGDHRSKDVLGCQGRECLSRLGVSQQLERQQVQGSYIGKRVASVAFGIYTQRESVSRCRVVRNGGGEGHDGGVSTNPFSVMSPSYSHENVSVGATKSDSKHFRQGCGCSSTMRTCAHAQGSRLEIDVKLRDSRRDGAKRRLEGCKHTSNSFSSSSSLSCNSGSNCAAMVGENNAGNYAQWKRRMQQRQDKKEGERIGSRM